MTAQDYQNAYAQGLLPSQITPSGSTNNAGGNYLGNLLSSLATPFVKTGQNIAGASFESNRALDQAIGSPVAHILGAQNDYTQKNGQEVADPFLSDKDLQQLQNPLGYIGNQVKNSANILSYAVPFGKGANFFTKGVLPGMVSGGLQGVSNPHATPGSIAADAATGGIIPGAGGLLGGLLHKISQPASKALSTAGTSFVQSQYNLPERLADQYNIHDNIKKIFTDTGITNIQKATDLAHELNSAIGNVVTGATNNTPAVDVGGLNSEIDKTLSKYYEIPANQKDEIGNIVRGGLGYSLDGTRDIVNANPNKILETIRNLEDNAADHWNDYSRPSGTTADKQKAMAFANFSDLIKNRFYNGRDNAGGMNQSLVDYVKKNPGVAQQVHAVAQKYNAPQLAIQFDQAVKAGDGQAVRHIMAPYVNVSHASNYAQDIVDKKVMSPFEFFGAMSQFGSNPLHALPALLAYKAINSNSGKSTLGKLLMTAGGRASSINGLGQNTSNRINALSAHVLPTLQGGSVQ